MENLNSYETQAAKTAERHNLPQVGLISRLGRWFQKRYMLIVLAGGSGLAAANCKFDTSGLTAPSRDAAVDARPIDDGSIPDADLDADLDAHTSDAQSDAETPDAQPDAVVEPDAQPDAETPDAQPDSQVPDCTTTCTDPACEGQSCNNDPGCTCIGGVKTETDCTDGVDNNGDGRADCQDETCHTTEPSCVGVEYCYDDISNNGNSLNNCYDPDCENECRGYTTRCTTAPYTGCSVGPGYSCTIGWCTETWSDGFQYCVCEYPTAP